MTSRHPCYSSGAQGRFARIHLPVAPACNISCNYCNRKYDCVNESRPGVTSEVLTPQEAADKFIRVKFEMPNLSVAGIAGPGDALANWDAVKKTVALIKRQASDVMFCLSTNGLMLPEYAPEIVGLGIKHVTVTVNCLNAAIGAQIYRHVVLDGVCLTGEQGAKILIRRQMEGIEYLSARGVLVKVNIVMIDGINSSHITEVVKKVKRLGAFMTNIMPLIPAPGSAFQNYPQTSMKDINAMREICEPDIPQMRHCRQCRADAVGLLSDDQSHRFRKEAPAKDNPEPSKAKTYRVAVTSKHRKLIDTHYGHAGEFHIYEVKGRDIAFIETRSAKKYCTGAECDQDDIREQTIKTIADCDAVLTMRAGYDAQKRLAANGLRCIESCTGIEEGLMDVPVRMEESVEVLSLPGK